MIIKKTTNGSILIGENEYPVNLFRLSYGVNNVTISPLVAINEFNPVTLNMSMLEDDEGEPFTSMETFKEYLSSVFFSKTGGTPGPDPTEEIEVLQTAVEALQEDKAEVVHTHVLDDITDATTIGKEIVSASNASAVRDAIGAGTSNLVIGITASTAMAGDTEIPEELPPTDGSVTNAKVATGAAIALNKLANVAAGDDGLAAGTIQATFQALATRIAALENI